MYHLAQLNIGRLLHPIDDPHISEFVKNLDRINTLAEASKGFVWRLKDESGNATSIEMFNDPLVIVNMSVWESLEDLSAFAYHSEHLAVMKRRREWFEKPTSPHLVLWWVPIKHTPTPGEAKKKLDLLRTKGESPLAFSFKTSFNMPSESRNH